MARTVLLTLGRLPKALDIARAFHHAGWRVLVAEPFTRHLTGVSRAVDRSFVVTAPADSRERYIEDLLGIVRRERVELVVPVSEEIFHASYLQAQLPADARFYGMPSTELLRLHDKQRFVARCGEFGLDAPETFALGDPQAEALTRQGPVVVKPILSCSGRGVRFLERGATLPSRAEAGHALVQRRVEGSVLTSFSIAHGGRTRCTVVYRGAVMSGTVAVCFERVEAHTAIERWVERFVAASGWTGFISFDFIVDAAGRAFAVECNPRATSGIHFLATEGLVAAMLDERASGAVPLRPERLRQQFYPTLTEVQKSAFSGAGSFRSNLARMLAADDVSWSLRDPLPFLTMVWTSWPIIDMARRKKCTFGEVATLDIGWYDEILHRHAA